MKQYRSIIFKEDHFKAYCVIRTHATVTKRDMISRRMKRKIRLHNEGDFESITFSVISSTMQTLQQSNQH